MKIVSAVNAMIATPQLINNVIPSRSGDEIFFLYNNKYKWSVSKIQNSDYSVFYYSGNEPLTSLANWQEESWYDYNQMIRYSASEIGTKEAKESFSELYRVVKENLFGINDVLEDIIDTADWA